MEQIEFNTNSTEDFEHAQKELDEIGIPYQILNRGDAQSLRITEGSGISFIYTLEKININHFIGGFKMAMLHEDWKSRTPIKQVMVVNTDAKNSQYQICLLLENNMMSSMKLKNIIKSLITLV